MNTNGLRRPVVVTTFGRIPVGGRFRFSPGPGAGVMQKVRTETGRVTYICLSNGEKPDDPVPAHRWASMGYTVYLAAA
jgi:hypothetical protein